MSLAIKTRIVSGVVILDLVGRLCSPEVALSVHIKQQQEQGRRGFVLNLADVPYIDSFGLGQLVTMWTLTHSKGGQLVLLQPTVNIQKLLEITKLNSVFQTYRDEAEAVRGALSGFVAA
jgi:anti-sigma B factor antagonist